MQDRAFKDGNEFSMSSNLFSNVGALGDEILVNGTHDPYVEVTHQRVRLRLLNASNARFFASPVPIVLHIVRRPAAEKCPATDTRLSLFSGLHSASIASSSPSAGGPHPTISNDDATMHGSARRRIRSC